MVAGMTLPWVLLGLRITPKVDLQSSSTELVYGQPLRVPGDFIPEANVLWSATAQRLGRLGTLYPCPLCSMATPGREIRAFLVDIGDKPAHVSVDCLKPAHLDTERPVQLAQSLQRGRPETTGLPRGPGDTAVVGMPSVIPAQEVQNCFGQVIRPSDRFSMPV
ncbi:hypothetical protein LDENG_00265830 [Lucifuga dentata]|nr:hypothetical protein LDENG_00265830 [Lucifuga dentata]